MSERKTQDFFIEQLKEIYKDKYDFSNTRYVNACTKVVFECHIHGEQTVRPDRLLGGYGCPKCGYAERTKRQKGRKCKTRTVYGIGACDDITVDKNSKTLKSYLAWANMLLRCYSDAYHRRQPSYIGCKVCDDWKKYSTFKKWYDENAVEGFQLDKDLVAHRERLYSPETCSFVPPIINHIVSRCGEHDRGRGKYLIGVCLHRGKFVANLSMYGKNVLIGRFDSEAEAFNAYKKAKETYIREVAKKYYNKGDINEKVYNALINYKITV